MKAPQKRLEQARATLAEDMPIQPPEPTPEEMAATHSKYYGKLRARDEDPTESRSRVRSHLSMKRYELYTSTSNLQRKQLRRGLKREGFEGSPGREADRAINPTPLDVLEEESTVSRVEPVGFQAGDKTGFAGAALKAVLGAYPDGYFDLHLANEFHDPAQEAVRKAMIALLDVSRGRRLGGENAAGELKALYAACQNFYQTHGIDDGPLSQMFNEVGEIQNPVNAHVFISELLNILELNDMPQTTGKMADFSTIDSHKWGAPLPECLAHGVPLSSGKKNKAIGVPLVLEVVPGDGAQTIQGCLDKMFAPAPPPTETAHFKANAQSLEKMGYTPGSDLTVEDKLAQLKPGDKLELPVEVAKQPRLSVDLDRFRTFSVSLDVFNPEGTELALPEEAAAITRDSGEFIMLPVTDNKTGRHYLVRMQQKSACVYDEQTGLYKTTIRDRQGWKCHDTDGVHDKPYKTSWNIKRPHAAHVIFYEVVGEPVPVPSAKITSLDQNQVDPEKLPDPQKQIALKVKEWTGRYPKAFRSSVDDILLSDLPLVPGHDPLSVLGQAAVLFDRLRNEKHNGKPLVEDPAEFIAMFSAVSATTRKNHSRIITAMKFFRDFQVKDPEKYVFPPATFAHLMAAGKLAPVKLEGVTDVSAADRRGLEEVAKRDQVKNAYKYIEDNIDLPVIDTMPAELAAAGIKVQGSGLWNFGNNCFMNAPLQAMAHGFKLAGNLEVLKDQPIPFSVARELIERKFPKQEEQREEGAPKLSDEEVDALTQQRNDEIDEATREAMAGRGKYAVRVKGFKKYYAFRDSLVALMEAVSDGQVHPELPDLQRQFYRNYLDISRDSNRFVAVMILGDDTKPDDIVPRKMQQEDPAEFIGDIYQLLGLDRDPDACILDVSTQKMIYKGQEVLQRPPRVPEPLAIVPLAMTGEQVPTIPKLIGNYCAEHNLPGDERINWSDDDCNDAGVPVKDKGLLDSRQINQFTIMGDRPPRRLMVTAKMFDYASELHPMRMVMNEKGEIEEKYVEPGAFKPLHEGSALARNTEITDTVRIPFTKPADPTASMTLGQQLTEDYSIKSIVCHAGKTCKGGHYIAIKFEKGETLICDDSMVVNLKDLHRLEGNSEPYRGWHDYCLRRGVQPYIFSLEATAPEYTEEEMEGEEDVYELAPEVHVTQTPPPPLTPLVTPAPSPILLPVDSEDDFSTPISGGEFVFPDTDKKDDDVSVAPTAVTTDGDDHSVESLAKSLEAISVPTTETHPPSGAPDPVTIGRVTVVSGDICKLKDQWGMDDIEAVVNAANERLEKGSGVCGAIFKAAGGGARKLQNECRKFNGCPLGEARTTKAYDLDSQWVDYIIHAVGPDMRKTERYQDDPAKAEADLKNAYQSAMAEAQSYGMGKIAIPALSVGVFGFDSQRGVEIAAEAIREYQAKYPEAPDVVFVVYHDGSDSQGTTQGEQLRSSMEIALSLPMVSPAPVVADMKIPPVLEAHCLPSDKYALDPVAKMNHRLFSTLSAEPLVEGTSDREGWGSWLWRMAVTYDQYKPSERLIKTTSEFARLFRKVPAEYRQNPEDMVVAVRQFKKMKAKTPAITPGMFSHMLQRGDLDPKKDVNEVDVNIDKIRSEADMPVVDPTLMTRSAVKFFPGFDSGHIDSAMQCSMHLMSQIFADPKLVEQLRQQEIPDHIQRQLVIASLSQGELDEGEALVARRLMEYGEGRGRYAGRRDEFELPYKNFQEDFSSLMQEMTEPVPSDSLAFMYQQCLESYKALCSATGRPIPSFVRSGQGGGSVQPSPLGLVTDMMDLLGMKDHPSYALKARENFTLAKDDTELEHKNGEHFKGAVIPLPVPAKTGNSSLQSIILDCAEESDMLSRAAANVWRDDELKKYQDSGAINGAVTRRAVTFECLDRKPPEQLMFEIEPPAAGGFGGSTIIPKTDKTFKSQLASIMRNTPVEVPVPLPVMRAGGETTTVNYLITDLVCRRVDTEGHSHYMSVQFRHGGVYLCDGSVVTELKEFRGEGGSQKRYSNWQEFCQQENLELCSMKLGREPISRGFEEWDTGAEYSSQAFSARQLYQHNVDDQYKVQREAFEKEQVRFREVEAARQLELQRENQAVKAAQKVELEIPVQDVKRTQKPGFRNLGNTCYAGAGLVCCIEGLSTGQLDRIQRALPGMELYEEQNVAKAFLNLARAYKVGASKKDIERHQKALMMGCHYLGKAAKDANRAKLNGKNDRSEVFVDLFPNPSSFHKFQDAEEFLTRLMETLRLNKDPSSTVTMRPDFVTEVDGVELRRPSNSAAERMGVLDLDVVSEAESTQEALLSMEVEEAGSKNVREFLSKKGFSSFEEYVKSKGLNPAGTSNLGLQEFVDQLTLEDERPLSYWYLDEIQNTEAYKAAKVARPDLDSHFDWVDETSSGDVRNFLRKDSAFKPVYEADLDQLESLMVRYKIFDSSGNKRVSRCSALKDRFDQQLMIPVRHTDGKMYDVVLEPTSIAAHSGGRDIRGGHYIGYTQGASGSEWVEHDDSKVSELDDFSDVYGDPYLINYRVVGYSLQSDQD